MAYIPDEAVLRFANLTRGAIILYAYYCKCRNKYSGGFSIPESRFLRDLPEMNRMTYYRARKELVKKGWILVGKNSWIEPLTGFGKEVENQPSDSNKTDTSTVSEMLRNKTDTVSEMLRNKTDTSTVTKLILDSNKTDTVHIMNTSHIPAPYQTPSQEGAVAKAESVTLSEKFVDETERKKTHPNQPSALSTGLEKETTVWLDAVAAAVGAKSRQTMPNQLRWRSVVTNLVREDFDLIKFLGVVKAEIQRTAGQPQYFTPEGCQKAAQMSGSVAAAEPRSPRGFTH